MKKPDSEKLLSIAEIIFDFILLLGSSSWLLKPGSLPESLTVAAASIGLLAVFTAARLRSGNRSNKIHRKSVLIFSVAVDFLVVISWLLQKLILKSPLPSSTSFIILSVFVLLVMNIIQLSKCK